MDRSDIRHTARDCSFSHFAPGAKREGQCLSRPPRYGINAAAVPFDDALPTYVRITDISEDGRFVPAPKVSVAHPHATGYLLEDGDHVFARTGASVGKSYCYDPNDGVLVFAGFLIQVTPDGNLLRSGFLKQYVQTGAYWGWVATMSARSGQPGINGKEYGTLLLPLPPTTHEQQAIAETLSDVDGLIGALEKLIAKKRAIKQAAMQQLLTGKTRLPGFSGEWKTKLIGEIGEVASAGVDKKRRKDERPVRLVNYMDAYRGIPIRSPMLDHWVTAPQKKTTRCGIQAGDVFFTPSSEVPDDIAKSAVAMETIPDAVYSYHVVRLRALRFLDEHFRCFVGYRFGDHCVGTAPRQDAADQARHDAATSHRPRAAGAAGADGGCLMKEGPCHV